MASIPNGRQSRYSADIAVAHTLVDMGVSVFPTRLNAKGGPTRRAWQLTKPDHALVDEWHSGMALAARTGMVFDVLDVDPRNGGELSWKRLASELGDDGPEVYWKVATPSGGHHFWIASLGVGSHHPIRPDLPGVDLQGAGTCVFLPGTERKGGIYTAGTPRLASLNGTGPSAALIRALSSSTDSGASGPGRRTAGELRRKALGAGPGEQRGALLSLVREWEYMGCDRDEIVEQCVALGLKNFDARRPWKPTDFAGILDSPGRIVGDARPGELDGIGSAGRPSGLVRPFSSIEEGITQWLWELYLAVGEISLIDGEKGVGKSTTWLDVAARGSRGRAMPGEAEAICGPFNTLILSPENRVRHIIKPRLRAAGADMERIFAPEDIPVKRGKAPEMYLLPDAAPLIGRMIREAQARLLVIDPITAFLMPHINSHNDASVRSALAPLARELAEHECAGAFSRNMNKSTTQADKDRGSGSHAFSDLARVHLLAMRLPDDWAGEGEFGLRPASTNMTVLDTSTLTFSIVDSDVPLDDRGHFISRIDWHDREEISYARRSGPGPEPEVQDEVIDVLEQMFRVKDPWRAKDAEAELKSAGVSTNKVTVAKARKRLGIRSVQRGGDGGNYYAWTRAPKREAQRGRRG